eukprot:CAMPEP_0201173084 /NCGR_PEP_ID=MMETSP0851-20130426/93930_1 /ASSEMBLY_ACC=CAM_ASM_000631 /TAXON_ID=183588 /ORGANISM="Pseudo-nitzschia fraudulenta, Strain WWA7" /LENGTH=38 /DNA_ID= /DNA_START= /DNA_END= /DNA_ORIENTATION=
MTMSRGGHRLRELVDRCAIEGACTPTAMLSALPFSGVS